MKPCKSKIGIKAVYDLSATPFFLRGSGYAEGTLFPWVVSDFSLIDAIESGIVKVPRVPVADDSMTGEQPTYRDLWLRIRDDLPRKGRETEAVGGEPKLPVELQGALHSLYGNYEKYYRLWEQEQRGQRQRPDAARLHRRLQQHERLQAGLRLHRRLGEEAPERLDRTCPRPAPHFQQRRRTGDWTPRPNHDPDRQPATRIRRCHEPRVQEDRRASRSRSSKPNTAPGFPGRDAENLTDEDLLREVMNTVGKPGKLGEHVKCVVSVSMLTEGLGREHRHPRPGRPRLRHAASLRAGRRPRACAG